MIYIDFDPNQYAGNEKDAWERLTQAAINQRAEVVQEYQKRRASAPVKKPSMSSAVKSEGYKELKEWFYERVFNRKCGYCEARVKRKDLVTDHYRPKGEVSIKSLKDPSRDEHEHNVTYTTVKSMYEDGVKRTHPGYFWVAYDWRNLIPACNTCNDKPAKYTSFPVKNTHALFSDEESKNGDYKGVALETDPKHFMLSPDELDALEQPLILHPLRDSDLADHLSFDNKGIALGVTERGKATILNLYLNREELVTEERPKALRDLKNDYHLKCLALKNMDTYDTDRKNIITDILNNMHTKEYSAALSAFFKAITGI
ncbi:MAG: hypothetical protein QNK37_34680 [Acidobacteriota bacterium]|nr:hypothetical protein [Acidobacteriota bacterium]